MSDERWIDVTDAVGSAVRHFQGAAAIFAAGGFGPEARDSYVKLMALLHAMQSGHTSYETALVRTLGILDEHLPTGSDWHSQLIVRCAAEIPGRRPAIISPEMARWAHETRAFRHLAMHSYDFVFDAAKAARAVEAGTHLAAALPSAIAAFAAAVDS